MSMRGRVARQLMTTPWVHPKTGGLYYRKVVPPRARHLFGGKVEVRRSLGTRDPRQARVRYAEIAREVEARIAAASAPPAPATHEQLCALAGEWYRRKLAAWGPEPGAPREWGALAQDLHEDVKALIARDRRDRGAPRATCRSARGRVAGEAEPAAGILRGDGRERRAEGGLQGLLGAGADRPQPGLELGPGRLDRAHVRRVGRQVAVARPGAAERLAHLPGLV